jgi:hypothetical protein
MFGDRSLGVVSLGAHRHPSVDGFAVILWTDGTVGGPLEAAG